MNEIKNLMNRQTVALEKIANHLCGENAKSVEVEKVVATSATPAPAAKIVSGAVKGQVVPKGSALVNGVVMDRKSIMAALKEKGLAVDVKWSTDRMGGVLDGILKGDITNGTIGKFNNAAPKSPESEPETEEASFDLDDAKEPEGDDNFFDEEPPAVEKPVPARTVSLEEIKTIGRTFVATHGEAIAKAIFAKYGKKMSELSADERLKLAIAYETFKA